MTYTEVLNKVAQDIAQPGFIDYEANKRRAREIADPMERRLFLVNNSIADEPAPKFHASVRDFSDFKQAYDDYEKTWADYLNKYLPENEPESVMPTTIETGVKNDIPYIRAGNDPAGLAHNDVNGPRKVPMQKTQSYKGHRMTYNEMLNTVAFENQLRKSAGTIAEDLGYKAPMEIKIPRTSFRPVQTKSELEAKKWDFEQKKQIEEIRALVDKYNKQNQEHVAEEARKEEERKQRELDKAPQEKQKPLHGLHEMSSGLGQLIGAGNSVADQIARAAKEERKRHSFVARSFEAFKDTTLEDWRKAIEAAKSSGTKRIEVTKTKEYPDPNKASEKQLRDFDKNKKEFGHQKALEYYHRGVQRIEAKLPKAERVEAKDPEPKSEPRAK